MGRKNTASSEETTYKVKKIIFRATYASRTLIPPFSVRWLKWNIVTIFRLSPVSQTFSSSCQRNSNGKVWSHKLKSIRDTYGGVKVRLNYCRMTRAILLRHLIAFLHHLRIQGCKNSMIFSLRYVSPEKGRCIFQANKKQYVSGVKAINRGCCIPASIFTTKKSTAFVLVSNFATVCSAVWCSRFLAQSYTHRLR